MYLICVHNFTNIQLFIDESEKYQQLMVAGKYPFEPWLPVGKMVFILLYKNAPSFFMKDAFGC